MEQSLLQLNLIFIHLRIKLLNILFSLKWPNGYCCEKCGNDTYFKAKTRELPLYECKKCRYQATVTVGTKVLVG